MPETNFFWNPLSDNILQERDETGAVTAEYTTEPGLYGNLISQNRGGTESQYHFDALGSTLGVTDDNQQVTDTYAYTAFGEMAEHMGSTISPFQYVGQKEYYRDTQASKYLVRTRPLSPLESRWLSTDRRYILDAVNAYWYVANNPLVLLDPSGQTPFDTLGDSQRQAISPLLQAAAITLPGLGNISLGPPCAQFSVVAGFPSIRFTGRGTCPDPDKFVEGIIVRTLVKRQIDMQLKTMGIPFVRASKCPDPCRCNLLVTRVFPFFVTFLVFKVIYFQPGDFTDRWDPDENDGKPPPAGEGYEKCELRIRITIPGRIQLDVGVCA